MADKPIIELSHISKIYQMGEMRTVAIKNISLTIQSGEFVAIMGPSGSGKSTLMHILGALDLASEGTYVLNGKDVSTLPDDALAEIRNSAIGFVFQAYNLLPRTSALDNVRLPMEYGGLPEIEQVNRATHLLTLVGLADRMLYPPHRLSGGQQQRVAIARALAMTPAIILADEPTGNIASDQAEEIMTVFHNLHMNEGGHTIVMITHEPDVAAHADRIIHLKDGVIVDDRHKMKQKGIR